MISNTNRALDAAIALSRAPTLARAMQSQPLPPDADLLLRILAKDADAVAEARRMTGLNDKDLAGISELYVLQVMLYRGASPRRILGVGPEAERTEMRAHMRYLLTWLHPDKAASDWHAAFASRVIGAWRSLNRIEEFEGPRATGDGASRKLLARGVPWIARSSERTRTRPVPLFYRRLRAFFEGFVAISAVSLVNGGPPSVPPFVVSAHATPDQVVSSAAERAIHPSSRGKSAA